MSVALYGCSTNTSTTAAKKTPNQVVTGPSDNQTTSAPTTNLSPAAQGSSNTPAPSSSRNGISPPPTTTTTPVIASGPEVTTAEQFMRLYLDYNWSTTPNQLSQLQQRLAQLAATPLVQQALARWQGAPGYQLQSQQTVMQAAVENAQVAPNNPNEVVALMVVTIQASGVLTPQQQHQVWDIILAPQPGGTWQAQAVNQVETY
jgi:hypothetical protein